MISYLKGRVILKESEYIVLEVGGVGYKVYLTKALLERAHEGTEQFEVFCFLRVKEDGLELYGMESWDALRVFEAVDKISGIGPKTALDLASFGSMEALHKAVEEKGANVFEGIKGLGKKKVQKILLELNGTWAAQADDTPKEQASTEEALKGLMALGFSKKDSTQALSQISPAAVSVEEQVKEALKYLGQ